MLWKKKAHTPQPPGNTDQKGTLYEQLKKEIRPVRPQGDLPARDPASFSRYGCDLCHTPHGIEELRQCGLCGRWTCPSCRNDEFYICSSCNGILKLHTFRTMRQ